MERITLASGLSLSRIVYGTWRLARAEDVSPAAVRRTIDACLAQGITTFDLADVYGDHRTEALFGRALADDPTLRDELQIITKCSVMLKSEQRPDTWVKHYDTSARHIVGAVERSLRDLQVENVDLLLIHRPDPLMEPAETAAALDGLVEAGKVRGVGVSNFSVAELSLLQSASASKLLVNQIELSLAHPAAMADGTLAGLMERGVRPMAWSPLGGGRLLSDGPERLRSLLAHIADTQGVTPSAVALAFLLRHPAGILPVVGTNSVTRIAETAAALTVEIDRQTWFALYEAARGHPVA